jgi:hypothetical protein
METNNRRLVTYGALALTLIGTAAVNTNPAFASDPFRAGTNRLEWRSADYLSTVGGDALGLSQDWQPNGQLIGRLMQGSTSGSAVPVQLNGWEAQLTVDGYVATVHRLVGLLKHEDPGERPDSSAYQMARDYLDGVDKQTRVFPRAAVTVDDDGSLYFLWRSSGRSIVLTVPAAQATRPLHIYWYDAEQHDTVWQPTPDDLVSRLAWLASE